MFDSIGDMAVGTTGTAGYLLLWNGVLKTSKATPEAAPEVVSRARSRTRIWHVFLLFMTPYVLLLFSVMEAVR